MRITSLFSNAGPLGRRSCRSAAAVSLLVVAIAAAGAEAKDGPAAPTHEANSTKPPAWAADARWYYIDVSRFANGDPSNDVRTTRPWAVDARVPRRHDRKSPLEPLQFGADFRGVIQRLPYLKTLGVNTLYLGSVFHQLKGLERGPVDIRHVGDIFGTINSYANVTGGDAPPERWIWTESDKLFQSLIAKAHEAGMRVVLEFDTGYRPTNRDHRRFEDQTTTDYVRAVARRWTDPNLDGNPSDGVDGWVITRRSGDRDGGGTRLVKAVLELNPNALIVRDRNVTDKENRELGIPWNDSMIDSIANSLVSTGRMAPRARALFSGNPAIASEAAVAFPLSPGWSERAMRRCISQAASSENPAAITSPTEEAYHRYRLLLILEHTLPGAPVTMYGDEVGMLDARTETTPALMWWPDLPDPVTKSPYYHGDIYGLIKWLHEFRKEHESIRRGSFRAISLDEQARTLAFGRAMDGEEVIVLANYGDTKRKFMVTAGVPGQMVAVITPHLLGKSLRRRPKPDGDGDGPAFPQPTPLEFSGSRQFVNNNGQIRVWVEPMSARLAVIRDKEPRR